MADTWIIEPATGTVWELDDLREELARDGDPMDDFDTIYGGAERVEWVADLRIIPSHKNDYLADAWNTDTYYVTDDEGFTPGDIPATEVAIHRTLWRRI